MSPLIIATTFIITTLIIPMYASMYGITVAAGSNGRGETAAPGSGQRGRFHAYSTAGPGGYAPSAFRGLAEKTGR
jgi:hypothetical protein